MKKVCVIAASVGENLKLANSIVAHLEKQNAKVSLINIVELHLPLYSSIAESHHIAEELMKPLKEKSEVDAFVIVAPEYNGGPPPAFTNFIAWISRSTKNWRETFNRKTGLIASASGGGGLHVLMILRMQLAFIGMNVIGRQILSTPHKPFKEEEIDKACRELLESFN